MPNRILKESIWRSESLNKCSLDAQAFFVRMIPYPDDFGRFDARTPIIRATLYPLRYAEITEKKIESWLDEVVKAGMVKIYEVEGVKYGYFTNWNKHQQQRVKKSKYPDPPSDDSTCNQMISGDGICCDESNPIQSNPIRIQSESESESESECLNSDEFRLAEHLFSKIQSRNNQFKKPDLTAWAKEIDLMIRIDGRDPPAIQAVIDWCQNDEFWQNNILSTGKLRKQFDQLSMKMRSNGNGNGYRSGAGQTGTRAGAATITARSDENPYPPDREF